MRYQPKINSVSFYFNFFEKNGLKQHNGGGNCLVPKVLTIKTQGRK